MLNQAKSQKLIIFLICVVSFGMPKSASATESSYQSYLSLYSDAPVITGHIIEIDAASFSGAFPEPTVVRDFQGNPGAAILTGEAGYVEFAFHVEYAGLYNIYIEYFPVEGRGNDIERRLLINGELPFNNAAFINFNRFWALDGNIVQDRRGNDLRPSHAEVPHWQGAYFSDYLGNENRPYLFYFHEGENTLRLEASREPMTIRRVALQVMPESLSYNEVSVGQTSLPLYRGKPITIQGENFAKSTSRMIYPLNDRSSPATEPSHPYLIRLNTVGGYQWRFPGQTIYWTFTAPESALYQINIKYRQNLANGTFVTRNVCIDGETPFSEMGNIQYPFNSRWRITPLSGEDGVPFRFYLEAGEHTLSMEVVLGDWAEILAAANDSVFQLNYAYRQMLLILGSTPDPFRDYQLQRLMPDAIEILGRQHNIISGLINRVIELNGGQRGEGISILENLNFQLRNMYADPETIPERWNVFRDNVSALGTWIRNVREQPLEIDFITITAPGASLPRPEAGFFQNLWHEIRALIASFTQDFSLVGDVHDSRARAVDVWIINRPVSGSQHTSGRDHAQILKSMIDNDFTPRTGIPVNLRLVSSDMVLPSAVTGHGPDVLLGMTYGDPVDWALRGAVASLSGLPGLDDVLSDFHPSAWEPFTLNGQLYALPETQSFYMMFARLDILNEMGLPVPQTWDEFETVMTELQRNNMDVHIPYAFPWDIGFFMSELYQRGGEVYRNNGMSSALDSEESIQAFRKWTNYFTQYGAAVFDWDPATRFINRFRNGEMPLGFADYTSFNVLSVFAPELRGLWQFYPLPGTLGADGQLNRSTTAGGLASMMLSSSVNQLQAWEFLRWWAGARTQTLYGHELETLIGEAARYPTANRRAMENLSWTVADYQMLSAQWDWARAFPQVPGGYFTGRHVSNAFRTVVNNLADPRETLWDFIEVINSELINKRKEFGLPYEL
jgi:ABC-type glycerol-3-phosphate transport system substrate-binding protein